MIFLLVVGGYIWIWGLLSHQICSSWFSGSFAAWGHLRQYICLSYISSWYWNSGFRWRWENYIQVLKFYDVEIELVYVNCREKEKIWAYQYDSCIFRLYEGWWSCWEGFQWDQMWHIYHPLQFWGCHVSHCNCWTLSSEFLPWRICWSDWCWFYALCGFMLPVEMVWDHWKVSCQKEW